MSPDPARATLPGGPRSPGLRWRGVLVRAGVAAVIALWAVLPFAHWTTTPAHLRFLIPWLLDPRTSFLPLALVLFLLLTVPGLLRRLSGEPVAALMVSAPHPVAGVAGDAEAGGEEDVLHIPTAPLSELDPEVRWEMAEALDIRWRDELIHDHRSWTIACLEASRARAAYGGEGGVSASGPGR